MPPPVNRQVTSKDVLYAFERIGTPKLVAQYGFYYTVIKGMSEFSAAGGLLMGCSVGMTQIGLMFSMVLAPMFSFGCIYYPWSVLTSFPVLQKVVLLNPLVYASEGLRGTLAPQYPHISYMVVIVALAVTDVLLIVLGLKQFYRKAIS